VHAPTGTLPVPEEAVEELVDRHVEAGGSGPGLAYGIVRDGRLVHEGGRGELRAGGPTPDGTTAFRIASMTKSFTAATVLALRDEGALNLDDEITRHVPEAAALEPPTDDAPAVTIRALLTMTAGLPTDDPWGDRQQDLPDDAFADLLRGGLSFAWTPGTAYEYSNTGYALLGRAVASAAGEPYADAVRRRLLDPLGMTSTVFTAHEVPAAHLAQGHRQGPDGEWQEVPFAGHGAYAPMGGLLSTVADLAVWIGGFTGAFPPRDGDGDGHPLRRASRREQQQPHRSSEPSVMWRSLAEPPVVRGQAYGFGLVVEQDPVVGDLVGHGGGYPGFGTHMRWHPASGLGVVVLSNSTYAPSTRLTGTLLDLLLSRHATAEPAGRPLGPVPGAAAGPVPRPDDPARDMTGATLAARADVVRLLQRWDEALAARLFAGNVDLDEPLAERRTLVERIAEEFGTLAPEPLDPWSRSPAHAGWWLAGRGGRVRVEIRLSPERPPRVQTLSVTAVPDPPAPVVRLARRVAAALGEPAPDWPPGWDVADRPEVLRCLRVAAAWAGACRVSAVLGGDGASQATFRLEGRVPLLLRLSWTPGTTALTSCTLTPALR